MFSTSLLIQPQISKNFLRLPSFGHITSFKKNNSTFAKDKNKRSGVSKLHPFSSPLCSNIPSTNSFWSGFWGTKTHFLEGIWSTREFQPIFQPQQLPRSYAVTPAVTRPPRFGAPAFRCSASLKRTPDKLEVETSEEGGFKVAWSYQKTTQFGWSFLYWSVAIFSLTIMDLEFHLKSPNNNNSPGICLIILGRI